MLIIIIQLETAVYHNENEYLESPLSSFNLLLLKMIKETHSGCQCDGPSRGRSTA